MRVGARTPGPVVEVDAEFGYRVTERHVRARYQADELRETRAQYHLALSELKRPKAVVEQAQRNSDRATTNCST